VLEPVAVPLQGRDRLELQAPSLHLHREQPGQDREPWRGVLSVAQEEIPGRAIRPVVQVGTEPEPVQRRRRCPPGRGPLARTPARRSAESIGRSPHDGTRGAPPPPPPFQPLIPAGQPGSSSQRR
jgi:hypothetical protein